jgi:hypothetical protein
MKDRNRLRTPLAPQGCGGPGTPGDFARSGYRYRARSVRSLRHPAHPVSAARHDLVSVHIYPTPTPHQQPHPKSAPAPGARKHQNRGPPQGDHPPPPPAAAPHRPRIPPPRRDHPAKKKIDMQMRERKEEKQPLGLKWNANRSSLMGVIK